MKKFVIILIATVGTLSAAIFGWKVYAEANFIATTEREPFTNLNLDRKTLRRAYNQMFRDVASGRFDPEGLEEADMDVELMIRYNRLEVEK